jgi:hypothetical protein
LGIAVIRKLRKMAFPAPKPIAIPYFSLPKRRRMRRYEQEHPAEQTYWPTSHDEAIGILSSTSTYRTNKFGPCARAQTQELAMRKSRVNVVFVAALGLLVSVGLSTPTRAETGAVSVVFTKGGLIVGVGGGQGVLTFRGKNYPFTVSGMSVGFTVGASTTKYVGKALNIHNPGDLAGSYAAAGAGGAVAAGAGGVQLQNAKGVILQLSGPKVGAEVSAAVGGVTITMR